MREGPVDDCLDHGVSIGDVGRAGSGRGGVGYLGRVVHGDGVRLVVEAVREHHAHARGHERGVQVPLEDEAWSSVAHAVEPDYLVCRTVELDGADDGPGICGQVVPERHGGVRCDGVRYLLPRERPELVLDDRADGIYYLDVRVAGVLEDARGRAVRGPRGAPVGAGGGDFTARLRNGSERVAVRDELTDIALHPLSGRSPGDGGGAGGSRPGVLPGAVS